MKMKQDRRTSQPRARLSPSQVRRKTPRPKETMWIPNRKRNLRPTALRKRPGRRPTPKPKHLGHLRKRKRHLLRVPGRAPELLVAPSVVPLRRLRKRKLRQRRPRVGRSDPSFLDFLMLPLVSVLLCHIPPLYCLCHCESHVLQNKTRQWSEIMNVLGVGSLAFTRCWTV